MQQLNMASANARLGSWKLIHTKYQSQPTQKHLSPGNRTIDQIEWKTTYEWIICSMTSRLNCE